MIYYKVKRLKSSSCNAIFFMILSFAALQVLFNIFFLKLGVNRRRLWNSSKIEMYLIWNDFFSVPFRNGHFHNVISTLANVVKLDVVNSNVEIHNVVPMLIWGCTTSQCLMNQKTTLKQRWNSCIVNSFFRR